MKDERPTHLDLFSGIGGFALAAHWAGFRTIGFCEIDKYCSRWLSERFPHIPNFGNIRNITLGTIGTPDLITGGFPCQPFSTAGKQRGNSDERYLWDELFRVICLLRPTFALIENVPGVFSTDNGYTPNRIFSDLCSVGYDLLWNCVPACSVGSPQQRDRLWIVSYTEYNGSSTAKPGLGKERTTEGQNELFKSQGPRSFCDTTIERFPNWSGGAVGQPKAITEFERSSRREVERDFCGVAHGVRNRVDRLKALGNAIVPQVAYEILREIRNLI